ncbi:MAG: methyl-accepting chemotaxis protein [Bacteroidales bacterium]|nr:methyl-accepting chemotaxis protein [Bacteroidales bacterium]
MKWNDLKLLSKFSVAFGVVIFLLVIVAIWGIIRINGIVVNAEEIIDGNRLRAELERKYVQHLHWTQHVNEFLTNDEINELNVQLDHTRSEFGKWLHGEGKENAVKLAPELEPYLEKMVEPNRRLHELAAEINEVYKEADRELSAYLREEKTNYLIYAHRVKDVAVNAVRVDNINVQKDPKLSEFGKWLYADETKQLVKENPGLAKVFDQMGEAHNHIHERVHTMEKYFRRNRIKEGKTYYMTQIKPEVYVLLEGMDVVIEWNDQKLSGIEEANRIYSIEVLPIVTAMKGMFNDVIEKSKDVILTDDVLLTKSNNARLGIITFSIIAIIVAIIMAIIMSRGIINGINKGLNFVKEVANGNYDADIDIDQKDEIGLLALSMKEMLESIRYLASKVIMISKGNLSKDVDLDDKLKGKGELAEALQVMIDKLRNIADNIIQGANQISVASAELTLSSQQMSQGANEQAASVEEISSTMEQISANIEQNTTNAVQTETISVKASQNVKEVRESSNNSLASITDISQKITIINDIAFQTNILALNAAVEAARAGDHGRGFAVVASEVRKLAERSKKAADEIVSSSQISVDITNKASSLLESLMPEINKTASLVQEIAAANGEQSNGVSQVNNAVQQLNVVTQQNASASEEIASNSEELSAQAEQLKSMISFFKIDQDQEFTAPAQSKQQGVKGKNLYVKSENQSSLVQEANMIKTEQQESEKMDDFQNF